MSGQKTKGKEKQNAEKGKILKFVRSGENFEKAADSRLAADDPSGALVLLQRAIEVSGERDSVLFKAAEILTDIGCYQDALGFLAPLTDTENELRFEAARLLAYCYLGMYEFDAASDCFFRFFNYADVQNYSPEFLETVCDAADYCEENRSDFDDDYESFADARPAVRDSAEIEIENILRRAGGLAKKQDADGVKRLLNSALQKYPESADLSMMMMFACYCGFDYKAGISYYEKLPEAERGQLRALCIAAALYHGAGLEEKAGECCAVLRGREMESPEEYSAACSMMIEIGRYSDAAELAKKSLAEFEYSKLLMHNYAKALYESGDYTPAKEQYEKISKLNFNDPIAAYYKNLCRETIADGKKRTIATDYALPSSQIIKGLRKIAELIGLNDKDTEKLRERWNKGDRELFSLFCWALLDKEPKFANAFAHLTARLGGKTSENILRFILLDPYSDETTKQIALGALKAAGLHGPFLAFFNGRTVEADIDVSFSPKKKAPAALTKINSLLLSHIQDCGNDVKERVKRLIYEFVLDFAENEYELTEAQRSAFAVVLEYYARRAQGKDDFDKHALIELRGITERRFINAEYRLLNVLKKALGEEIED